MRKTTLVCDQCGDSTSEPDRHGWLQLDARDDTKLPVGVDDGIDLCRTCTWDFAVWLALGPDKDETLFVGFQEEGIQVISEGEDGPEVHFQENESD